MAGRGRKTWTRAAVCAAALVTPLAVSGCHSGNNSATGAQAGSSSTPTAGSTSSAGTGSSTPSASAPTSASASTSDSSSSSVSTLNATAGGLTVATGEDSTILMNGHAINFGTKVIDPAWSPDGSHVVFIDGGGNLVVANADGTGKTEAARNPGGQNWSHPTWQTTQADPKDNLPERDAIFFAETVSGVSTLWKVPTNAHDAQPQQLTLNGESGPSAVPPPKTGNLWPSGGGKYGSAVYEHDNGGSSDVYIRDDFLRQQGGLAIKDAAEPDFVLVGGSATTEGTPEIVFVRKVSGHAHVFVTTTQTSVGGSNSTPRDLTPNVSTDCSYPALSPDGKTVAFSTPSGVETISVTGSGTPKQVTSVPGFPAFRPGS